MTASLILLCAAGTAMSRVGGFPSADESLDAAGLRSASECRLPGRFQGRVAAAPTRAARETAIAMGLSAQDEPLLADIAHGDWSGGTFADVHAAHPAELTAWVADPSRGAPGGETFASVQQRVGQWLDAIAGQDGPVCGITHATVIRAALAHAIGIPPGSTLAIDIAPLSRAVLSFNRVWRLQAIGPFD